MTPRVQFTLVLIQAVFVQTLSFGLRPTLSYAVLDAGGSGSVLGVLTAAFALPSLLLALPIGHVMDRIGERPLLVAGPTAMLAASVVALLFTQSVPLLILSTVLVGIGHLSTVLSTQGVLANRFAGGRADSVFGYYTFAASLGQTLGPLLLALPSDRPEMPPIETILVISIGTSIVMLALASVMKSSPRQRLEKQRHLVTTTMSLLRINGVIRALIATSIVLATIDLFVVYMPLLGHERELTTVTVSVMLVVRSAASMLSRLFLGVLVRRSGRRRLVVGSIAISALALAATVMPVPQPALIALSAVYGFFIGICQPITLSWISELAPPGTRGLAMSLRLAANRVGQTALPAALGVLAVASGAVGVLLAAAGTLVVAAWSSAALPDSSTDTATGDHDLG
ncbi:putative MFS family arabinose efflux permease [Paramicrobacterium agarici]|uniref:Putative MFS family arabinose efflux permease n=1 Tax=Paramicrobacterium agarici TaxID=630514 RepID=A0A2A9DT02_9MICO|nr:putative MFS family arabinose efflux permease [Microbacterium agarici]